MAKTIQEFIASLSPERQEAIRQGVEVLKAADRLYHALEARKDEESVIAAEVLIKQIEDGEIMTVPLSELVKRLQDLDAE